MHVHVRDIATIVVRLRVQNNNISDRERAMSFGYIGIINTTTHSFWSDIGNGLNNIGRLGEFCRGQKQLSINPTNETAKDVRGTGPVHSFQHSNAPSHAIRANWVVGENRIGIKTTPRCLPFYTIRFIPKPKNRRVPRPSSKDS